MRDGEEELDRERKADRNKRQGPGNKRKTFSACCFLDCEREAASNGAHCHHSSPSCNTHVYGPPFPFGAVLAPPVRDTVGGRRVTGRLGKEDRRELSLPPPSTLSAWGARVHQDEHPAFKPEGVVVQRIYRGGRINNASGRKNDSGHRFSEGKRSVYRYTSPGCCSQEEEARISSFCGSVHFIFFFLAQLFGSDFRCRGSVMCRGLDESLCLTAAPAVALGNNEYRRACVACAR